MRTLIAIIVALLAALGWITWSVLAPADGSHDHALARPSGLVTPPDVGGVIEKSAIRDTGDIVLQRADSIRGVVVDSDGSPVAGVLVRCGSHYESDVERTLSKPDGSFTLRTTEPGGHCLFVGGATGSVAWKEMRLSAHELETQDVRIVLERLPRTTFHVVDARTHAPIERFGITIVDRGSVWAAPIFKMDELALEDHSGGIVQLGVPSNAHVIVEAVGCAPLEISADGQPSQTLELCRESAIRGRLVLKGSAVNAARIEVDREWLDENGEAGDINLGGEAGPLHTDVSEFTGRHRLFWSDRDGRFVVSGLSSGTYALKFVAPDSPDKSLGLLKVPFEDALELGDVDLERAAVVRGRVLTSPGDPPSRYRVYFDGDLNHPASIADAQGNFELRRVRAGAHSIGFGSAPVGCGPCAFAPRTQPLDLVEGEVREIVLDATACKPCTIVVHVVESGRPVPGTWVRAVVQFGQQGPADMRDLGRTDSEGRIQSELEGDVRFELFSTDEEGRSYADGESGLVAKPGGSIECTLEIGSGTLRIELPPRIAQNHMDRVVLELQERGSGPIRRTARMEELQKRNKDSGVEKQDVLLFERVRVGEYDASLRVERDEYGGEIGKTVTKLQFGPVTEHVIIDPGRETHLVLH